MSQVFTTIQQTVVCFVRRSLCFPLYRNFKLSQQIVKDVVSILKGGRKSVLHCFLKIYHLFNKSDTRYILNQLYIRDYCVWIQRADEDTIRSLGESLAPVSTLLIGSLYYVSQYMIFSRWFLIRKKLASIYWVSKRSAKD